MANEEGDQMAMEIVKMIIRPQRAQYSVSQLGPSQFPLGNWTIHRRDFYITNKKGLKLQCSHWEPQPRPTERLPCVIYLHGNASCRLEALQISNLVLTTGTTLFAVDLSGSGMSDGEYISLGVYEKEDVVSIVQHLHDEGKTSKILLWGRSMGAATSLMYCGETENVAQIVVGMILDSAFSSLTDLANDMMARYQIPAIARKPIMAYGLKKADAILVNKVGFEIGDLEPSKAAKKCKIPVLFLHGKGDDFIPPKHSERIYKDYAGDEKLLVVIEGTHDSNRPQWGIDHAYVFLQNKIIAGSVVVDPQTKEESIIQPISLVEMWKDRGNQFVKEKEDWEVAKYWYTHAITHLKDLVKKGKAQSRFLSSQGSGSEDEGLVKKWFGGFLSAREKGGEKEKKEKETLETDRVFGILYSNLALCFLKMKMASEALDAASMAIKFNRLFVRGYYRKSSAQMMLEQYHEALTTADEGLSISPDNFDLLQIKKEIKEMNLEGVGEKKKEKEKK